MFANIVFGFTLLYIITSQVCSTNATPSIQAAKITQPIQPGKRYERSTENNARCSGKNMKFDSPDKFACKYDDLCYQIFKDCCSDFVKKCGNQTSILDEGMNRQWQCFKLSRGLKGFPEKTGLWLIGNCPSDWPFDKIREKCETALNNFNLSTLDETLPVVSKVKRFTYQNKFCAICNRDENFVMFQINASAKVTPPESFTLAEKLKFIEENHGQVWLNIPSMAPRRYCIGKNYIETCENSSNPLNKACVEGFIEIVRKSGWEYYKNKNCAQCNKDIPCVPRGASGEPGSKPVICPLSGGGNQGGGQSGHQGEAGQTSITSFSFVFTMDDSFTHTTYIEEHDMCRYEYGKGIYDKDLQICRETIIPTFKHNLSNKFLVLITFIVSRQLRGDINSSLIAESFKLDSEQISRLELHDQVKVDDDTSGANIYMVASFYFTLTPFQELMLQNQNKVNASIESKKFLKLFHFSKSFTISWNNKSFTIIKVATKRLACFQGKKLQHNEYRLDKLFLYETKTEKNYSLNDYSILNDTNHVVLCSRLVLSDCLNGTYVKLFTNEFVILPDLSLYHNTSNTTYQFGDYQITESLNESNQYTFTFPGGTSKSNVSVSVCLPWLQRNYTRTLIRHRNTLVLEILTLFGFSVSSMFLLSLLITYGLFRELRTLPGLNVMSLALSMLLSNLIWLTSVRSFHTTMVCVVLAVLNHYLLLVIFHAMSIISRHSSYIFSQSFVVARSDKRLKTFAKYSLFVWLQPAVFVTICLALDKFSIFTFNYGFACWMGSKSANLYFFLLPVALLFVFNVASFIRMAVSLARKNNQTKLLKKKGVQNLKVCLKLATLVSFSYVFGFLRLIFPTFEAFEYLFVVFACFQGFYIGLAFVCTEKTFKLYRKRFTANRTECANIRGQELKL